MVMHMGGGRHILVREEDLMVIIDEIRLLRSLIGECVEYLREWRGPPSQVYRDASKLPQAP